MMEKNEEQPKTVLHPLHENNKNDNKSYQILNRGENNCIRLLTYNIFLRPPPIKTNENDWKDERLNLFIEELINFDVVCLQEMFGTWTNRRHYMIKKSKVTY